MLLFDIVRVRLILTLLVSCVVLSSCDKEVIKLQGKIKNCNDNSLIVKMISISGRKEKVIDTLAVENGEFYFKSKAVKPPVLLTFKGKDELKFDVWVGEYGERTINFNSSAQKTALVIGSVFNDELLRIKDKYQKLYLDPVAEKEKKITELQEQKESGKMNLEEEILLKECKMNVRKAYKLRKKSVLATYRNSPSNPVAMALIFDEYSRLTLWQKKECLKNSQKYFSDCGVNWQLKN